jgi:hypothetical protein
MNLIFHLLMSVILGCVQVVLFIVNLVVAIVMGIGIAIIFIPVLLFNLWVDRKTDDDNNF